jgi:hypothetical protein
MTEIKENIEKLEHFNNIKFPDTLSGQWVAIGKSGVLAIGPKRPDVEEASWGLGEYNPLLGRINGNPSKK